MDIVCVLGVVIRGGQQTVSLVQKEDYALLAMSGDFQLAPM